MSNGQENWSDVRVFLAVVQAGSTLGASRALGMPQPTVARRIDALENALGLDLFERDTRGFRATRDGTRLAEIARPLADAAAAFFATADQLARVTERVIRISATEAVFDRSFAGFLEEFQTDHPNVRFSFVPSDARVDLLAGDVDVAIRFGKDVGEPSLIARKFGSATPGIYASKSYAATRALPQSIDEIEGHPMAVYTGSNVPQGLVEWMNERVDPDQIVMRCSDVKSMATAIRMGVGIGPLPRALRGATQDLILCFALPEETGSSGWIVASPDAYKRPETRAFMKFIAPRMKQLLRLSED